jgi:hypothetical protein
MAEDSKFEMVLEYDSFWKSLELLTEEEAVMCVENHSKNKCIYMLVEVVIPG